MVGLAALFFILLVLVAILPFILLKARKKGTLESREEVEEEEDDPLYTLWVVHDRVIMTWGSRTSNRPLILQQCRWLVEINLLICLLYTWYSKRRNMHNIWSFVFLVKIQRPWTNLRTYKNYPTTHRIACIGLFSCYFAQRPLCIVKSVFFPHMRKLSQRSSLWNKKRLQLWKKYFLIIPHWYLLVKLFACSSVGSLIK